MSIPLYLRVMLEKAAVNSHGASIHAQYAKEDIRAVLNALDVPDWTYPVGSAEYPTPGWYCACWHDETGARNDGYGHTGIDLNVDRYPWDDVDRGQPVWAVTSGQVYAVGYSINYLGGIVIEIEHEGRPLWMRYWHLEFGKLAWVRLPGDAIQAGDLLGYIGNYHLGQGGDHVHLDVAKQPFQPHWWYPYHRDVHWIDPVPILEAHLDSDVIEAMLTKGDA